jgi:hypothetical protein
MSPSIAATTGAAVASAPSTKALLNPRRPIRWMQRTRVALGDFTDLVGRVVVDDYDFKRMPVQRGLHGVYQSDDVLNFIERRYDDSKL